MKLTHFDEKEHSTKSASAKAKTIIRFKPDVVLLEYPKESQKFFDKINKFNPLEKPEEEIKKFKKSIAKNLKKYPWLKGDIKVIEEIEKLWNKNKQVYIFAIDGPIELTNLRVNNGLLNLVWNYLRELYMFDKIKKIKKIFSKRKILVFCHNYHWKNICYLSKHPNNAEILEYYFKKEGITSFKELEDILKKRNRILFKYWKSRKI